MDLSHCPQCRRPIEFEQNQCDGCGAALRPSSNPRPRLIGRWRFQSLSPGWRIVLIVGAIFGALSMATDVVQLFSHGSSVGSRQRAATVPARVSRSHLAPYVVEKWARVRQLSQAQLVQTFLSDQTVIGTPLFSDVNVSGDQLQLWTQLADSLMLPDNLRLWADYAEAFAVWCGCDSETTVGYDTSFAGGGRKPALVYRINPQSGRAQLDQHG
jgi:hypothetical protein